MNIQFVSSLLYSDISALVFCRPILKTIDNLLVMGLVDDSEIKQLLRLIDPVTFSDIPDAQGLLQMNLEEDVKIQLCNIFHHLCDAQVRLVSSLVMNISYQLLLFMLDGLMKKV